MKATGIVRRIDDLGRVVIPKEIRRTMRIREGDPLEIFTNNEGEVVLKKYSVIEELSSFAKQYAESVAMTTGQTVCITDTDKVIACAGPEKKQLLEKQISRQLDSAIKERKNIVAKAGESQFIDITNGIQDMFSSQIINIIISEGDAIGTICMLSDKSGTMGESEKKICQMASIFLGRHTQS